MNIEREIKALKEIASFHRPKITSGDLEIGPDYFPLVLFTYGDFVHCAANGHYQIDKNGHWFDSLSALRAYNKTAIYFVLMRSYGEFTDTCDLSSGKICPFSGGTYRHWKNKSQRIISYAMNVEATLDYHERRLDNEGKCYLRDNGPT
jgi:hypothetical protein